MFYVANEAFWLESVTPELYDKYTGKPNGAITTADSGQTWEHAQTAGTGAALTVVSGKLTNTVTDASAQAGYIDAKLNTPVKRIGGKISWGAGSTGDGATTFVIWKTSVTNVLTAVPDSPAHLSVWPAAWEYGVWVSGVFTSLASGSFVTPLATDGTVYSCSISITGNVATINLPDGSTPTVSDPRIRTNAIYAGFECYYNNASTSARPQFIEVWADGDPVSSGPLGRSFVDTFSRSLTGSMGNADSGQAWSVAGLGTNPLSNLVVNGSQLSLTSIAGAGNGLNTYAAIGSDYPRYSVEQLVRLNPGTQPADTYSYLNFALQNVSNFVLLDSSNNLHVLTGNGSFQFVIGSAANAWYWLRTRVNGPRSYLKIWADGSSEPTSWTQISNDPSNNTTVQNQYVNPILINQSASSAVTWLVDSIEVFADDGLPLRIVGAVLDTTTRDIRLTAQDTTSITRDLRIIGQATDNTTRDLRLVGQATDQVVRDIRLVGQATDQTTRDIRLTGQDTANTIRDIRLVAQNSDASTRDLRITGQLTNSTTRDLRLTAQDTSFTTRDFRLTGQDVSSTTRDLRLQGQDTTSTTRDLRITAQDTATRSVDIRLTGTDVSSSTTSFRVVGQLNVIRPASDISTGTWGTTPIWSKLNEIIPNDTSLVTAGSASDTFEVALQTAPTPTTRTDHYLRYRLRDPSAGSLTFTITLLEGTTQIAQWTETSVPSTFTTYQRTLTQPQMDSITNYANLRVRISQG
jgi:hypothetical protein